MNRQAGIRRFSSFDLMGMKRQLRYLGIHRSSLRVQGTAVTSLAQETACVTSFLSLRDGMAGIT